MESTIKNRRNHPPKVVGSDMIMGIVKSHHNPTTRATGIDKATKIGNITFSVGSDLFIAVNIATNKKTVTAVEHK